VPLRVHRGEVPPRLAVAQRGEALWRPPLRVVAPPLMAEGVPQFRAALPRAAAPRAVLPRAAEEHRRREDAKTALDAAMNSNDEAALQAALHAGQELALPVELLERGVLRLSELQEERREAEAMALAEVEAARSAAAAAAAAAAASREGVSNALRAGPPAEVTIAYLAACTDNFAWATCGLGEGAFGRVYRGVDAESGARFAVKRLRDDIVDGRADAAVLAAMHRAAAQEVKVLSEFRHPHIVRLLAFAFEGAQRCLVYELLPGGSLDAAIPDDRRARELTWRTRVRIAACVAKALHYLHRGGGGFKCFHRDVKAANICLTADLSPQLIDCGLAKYVPAESGPQVSSGGRFGTPGYKCPRYEESGGYDDKSEAYSYGIVLLELITGEVQNHRRSLYTVFIEDEDEELEAAFDARAGEWPGPVKTELASMARECLDKYKKRCGLGAVLQRLVRLELAHCTPTVEEVHLAEARAELDRLRGAAQVATATSALQQRTCQVCYCECDLAAGVECSPPAGAAPHFLCNGCLAQYVGEQVANHTDANLRRFEQRGGVRCSHFIAPRAGQPVVAESCRAPVYTDAALAAHLPETTFALYFQAKAKVAEQRIHVEAARGFAAERAALEARIATLDLDERARQVRNHIVERILNPACPRCGQAFVDFDGCFALSCSRVGCSLPACGFCAYCLHDANGDAHAHVAECRHNIAPGRGVWASLEIFKEAQRRRCTRMIREYLATLDAASRARALRDCAQDLRDLGIAPNEI